jgi:hypothetical protein
MFNQFGWTSTLSEQNGRISSENLVDLQLHENWLDFNSIFYQAVSIKILK